MNWTAYKAFVIWFLVFYFSDNNNFLTSVECSVWSGAGGPKRAEQLASANELLSYFSKFTTSFLNRQRNLDDNPNLGKVLQFERSLQDKFKDMETKMRNKNNAILSSDTSIPHNPIKFPEASALSPTFLRNLSGHLETWMDLDETKKLGGEFKVLSQHILWIRSSGTKAGLSYFIYRPSFEAELDSSNILPHVKYHEEALETAQKVIETVMQYPNDQIIFAGLQSGGAIAMLHAWMVTSSVPIVFKNLQDYKGELHQIKIVLFDSDCVLSGIHAPNFPIPSWDILRFYSGKSKDISSSKCRFDSMKEIGLAYDFQFKWSDYFLQPSVQVSRASFVDYYDKSFKTKLEQFDSYENIDFGESFDDSASVAASEISMSVNGDEARNGYFQSKPQSRKYHQTTNKLQKLETKSEPVKSIEELIKPGIELLNFSISLSKFFYVNIKEIYKTHNQFYLKRNVNRCAAAMTETLANSLLGNNEKSPVVEKVIKSVKCSIESYNEKTKNAVIICILESKDSVKSSVLSFQTFVQNDMDAIITQNNVQIIENDWEEISMYGGRSISSSSESFFMPYKFGNGRSRVGSIAHGLPHDEDDRTLVTGFNERSEQWAQCLGELFAGAKHLNFINPINSVNEDENSYLKNESFGKSFLKIKLPFSSTDAVCEYSLLTQPKNYYQLYRTSSLMFYSIFSDAIKSNKMPEVCSTVLEPPNISHKNIGNAESISKTLNGYFNSDGTSQISAKNVVVNGLEIRESSTNLPSNNPYEIFSNSLCGILAECLNPDKVLEHLYDCNSHLTLWSGRQQCPEVCSYRFSGAGGSNLSRQSIHLCSRVVNCGQGVFLGFRGGKTFGTEKSLVEEFENVNFLARSNPAAFYAAFQLKDVNGLVSNLQKPFRFAVFLDENAKSSFIDVSNNDFSYQFPQPTQHSDEHSVQTFGSGTLKKRNKSENLIKLPNTNNDFVQEIVEKEFNKYEEGEDLSNQNSEEEEVEIYYALNTNAAKDFDDNDNSGKVEIYEEGEESHSKEFNNLIENVNIIDSEVVEAKDKCESELNGSKSTLITDKEFLDLDPNQTTTTTQKAEQGQIFFIPEAKDQVPEAVDGNNNNKDKNAKKKKNKK